MNQEKRCRHVMSTDNMAEDNEKHKNKDSKSNLVTLQNNLLLFTLLIFHNFTVSVGC